MLPHLPKKSAQAASKSGRESDMQDKTEESDMQGKTEARLC